MEISDQGIGLLFQEDIGCLEVRAVQGLEKLLWYG
jgi:hypothetical protein